LHDVPKRFASVVISIESLLDVSTMPIEEITDRLRAIEGRGDGEDEPAAGGKLLLIEEQWQARYKEKLSGVGGSKSRSSKGGQKSRPRGHKKKKNGRKEKEGRDTYCNCSKKGHWAKDCRSPWREQVNFIH
jgi:hypothetical protein